MKKLSRRTAIAAVFSAVIVASGIALAAWVASGTGSGFAQAGSAQDLTTSAVAASNADLYPGQNAGTLTVTINNPNPYPVKVTEIDAGSGSVTATGGTGTCTTTGVSLNSGLIGLDLEINANDSGTFDVSNAVSMDNTSDDGCQGATFEIPVSVSGESNA